MAGQSRVRSALVELAVDALAVLVVEVLEDAVVLAVVLVELDEVVLDAVVDPTDVVCDVVARLCSVDLFLATTEPQTPPTTAATTKTAMMTIQKVRSFRPRMVEEGVG